MRTPGQLVRVDEKARKTIEKGNKIIEGRPRKHGIHRG